MCQSLLSKRMLTKTNLQMLHLTKINLKMPLWFKLSKRMRRKKRQKRLQLLLQLLLKNLSNLHPNTKENKISKKLSLDISSQLKRKRKKNHQLATMDLNMLPKSTKRISKKHSQDTCQRAKSHLLKRLRSK